MNNSLTKTLEKCIKIEKSKGISKQKINEEINIGLKSLKDILNNKR